MIGWTWLLDTITLTCTFAPDMDEMTVPAYEDFILKEGDEVLAVDSIVWTTAKLVTLTAPLAENPAEPISLKFIRPSADFKSAEEQWVAKFEDLDVQETV